MTIDLTQENQDTIERALRLGSFRDHNEVIAAGLEMLAEDIDDIAVTVEREHETRYTLEEVEADQRARGKLA